MQWIERTGSYHEEEQRWRQIAFASKFIMRAVNIFIFVIYYFFHAPMRVFLNYTALYFSLGDTELDL